MKTNSEQNKKQKISARIAALCDLYRYELSKPAFEMYVSDIEDYNVELIDDAIRLHRRDVENGRFMPRPADIIAKINEITGSDERHIREAALVAWDSIMSAASSKGRFCDVQFSDPITQAVVNAMGGWLHFCSIYDNDRAKEQEQFEKRYVFFSRNNPEKIPEYFLGEYSKNKAPRIVDFKSYSAQNSPDDVLLIEKHAQSKAEHNKGLTAFNRTGF